MTTRTTPWHRPCEVRVILVPGYPGRKECAITKRIANENLEIIPLKGGGTPMTKQNVTAETREKRELGSRLWLAYYN